MVSLLILIPQKSSDQKKKMVENPYQLVNLSQRDIYYLETDGLLYVYGPENRSHNHFWIVAED